MTHEPNPILECIRAPQMNLALCLWKLAPASLGLPTQAVQAPLLPWLGDPSNSVPSYSWGALFDNNAGSLMPASVHHHRISKQAAAAAPQLWLTRMARWRSINGV